LPRLIFQVATFAAVAGVVSVFALILFNVSATGWASISWDFLTTAPRDFGRSGGIGPILVSTLGILSVCIIAALPTGIGCAVWLAEFTSREGRLAPVIRVSLDVLAGVPSIVFGLFGNAVFCLFLGMRFSILAGGLTLACMVLPLLIRTTEESIRTASLGYREVAASLGFSRTATLFRITLPLAAPGILAGLVLGTGRALSETAALIFTSGYADRMPSSLLHSGRSLSIHIYDLSMNVAGGDAMASATAVVLMGLLIAVNVTTGWLARATLSRHVQR